VRVRLIISSDLKSGDYEILGTICTAQVLKRESSYSDQKCLILYEFITLSLPVKN